MSRLPKLGILGSGSGSNCQSIYDAIQSGSLRAEIAVVMSDNPDAYILERARSWGIPAEVIDCGGFKTRFPEESQASVAARLKQYGVDCVCLAGFMRLVKLPLLKEFPSRILNIHPSLLPAFPGLHAWEQAVNAGAAPSIMWMTEWIPAPSWARLACPCCRGIRRKAFTPAFRSRSIPFIPP